MLAEAGYDTAVFGKWHLGSQKSGRDHVRAVGFDEYLVWERVDDDGAKNPKYRGALLQSHAGERRLGADEYTPDVLNAAAVSYVQRQRDRPYFLYYPMLLVHGPQHRPPGAEATAELDQRRRMIAYADRLIGRLVEAVRAAPGGGDALIVVTSDNGAAGAGKSELSDAGTRLPCVISRPGVVAAGRSDALVDMTDVLPTLADLAGASPPAGLDGRSFADHLLAVGPAPRQWVFSEWNGDWYIRDRRWTLHHDGRLEGPPDAGPDEARAAREALRAMLREAGLPDVR